MFKLFYKNKKGFSLHELIITVAIVGLVVGIAGTALFLFQNQHTASAMRWRVQNAVQLASTKFETNTNLIVNSKMLDVFYDSTIANGIYYDETNNTFTWKNGTPYVVPDEGSKDDDFSYIYSAPAWDANDHNRYIGHFLFIKNFGETTSTLFLDDEGFGDTPVEVEMSIATDFIPSPKPAGMKIKEYEKLIATERAATSHSYQGNGVVINLKSGNEEIISYQVTTTYVLENFNSSKQVNYQGGELIYEYDWIEGTTAKAYPCGWSDDTINGLGNRRNLGYPGITYSTVKKPDNTDYTHYFTDAELQQTGNVLRFLSPLSDMKVEDGDGQGTTSHKASCISTWLFEDGTLMGERVLDNLRNFRDNVLRGTEIGDWFINFYYYELSPFMIEQTAFLRPVYKAIIEPLSYVCDFIANL